MPLEMGLWKIAAGDTLVRLGKTRLESEALLETWIAQQSDLLGLDLLIIGRQVRTAHRGFIDLLAVDSEGTVHIIELKRDQTPREVVAQALDYASWVVTLESEDLNEISQAYLKKDLALAFSERFGTAIPETLNEQHAMTIVASALDASSERIVNYLALQHDLNINVVFFSIFGDGDAKMLGRSWLIDPDEVEQRIEAKSERRVAGDWTGFYFVNVGENEGRRWEDCQKYGMISGGQGERYRRAMLKLEPGDNVFAYIVGAGYVGYGQVKQPAVMARDFETNSGPLLDQTPRSSTLELYRDDEANAEYVVAVEWVKVFDRDHAQTFSGIFANQNIVCKIRDSRTVQFLAKQFSVPPAAESSVV
jgi:hypothetical protein